MEVRSMTSVNFVPSGSTDLARLSASEVARSVLAGVTARMRQVSLQMNCMIMSRIWASMSTGWSPTGILVRPGRSISVMFSTVRGWRRAILGRGRGRNGKRLLAFRNHCENMRIGENIARKGQGRGGVPMEIFRRRHLDKTYHMLPLSPPAAFLLPCLHNFERFFATLAVVVLPSGSADLASMRESEVAMSVLAGVTARMRQVSRSM